jgi:hypothetical protein
MGKARPSRASGKSGKAGKAKGRPTGSAKPRRAKPAPKTTVQTRGKSLRVVIVPRPVRPEKEPQESAVPEIPPPLPAPIASFTF